jgi:hypothetical protein
VWNWQMQVSRFFCVGMMDKNIIMVAQSCRNSSFELLRLFAQYMIVVYHILLFWFINIGTQIDLSLAAVRHKNHAE